MSGGERGLSETCPSFRRRRPGPGGSLAWGRCFSEMQLKRQVGCESMSSEGVTSVLSHSEI